MLRLVPAVLFLLLLRPAWGFDLDDPPRPPVAGNPVVDVKGTVSKVQIAPGQGMPFLELTSTQGSIRLMLGSMRYLMQEDFNPKAGEAIEARGYRMADGTVVGIRVELPGQRKTLKLRDENGWPLWMGGPRSGMGGGGGHHGPPQEKKEQK